jgi:hypothetical protein
MVMIMEVYLNEHSKVMMEKCVADTCGVFVDGGVYVFGFRHPCIYFEHRPSVKHCSMV